MVFKGNYLPRVHGETRSFISLSTDNVVSPVPWLSSTSASRSLPMICSGLNAFLTILIPPLYFIASLTQELVPFEGVRSKFIDGEKPLILTQ